MKERPPKDIEESIKTGNLEHLRAAGRKGAMKTNELKAIQRTIAEIEAELTAFETELMRRSANEHIISPDSEDQDYNSDTDTFDKK